MRVNLMIAAFPETASNFMVCDKETDETLDRFVAFVSDTENVLNLIQGKGYEIDNVTIYGPQSYILGVSNDFTREGAPFAKYFSGKVTCYSPGKE